MGDADYYADGQWNFTCELCGKKAKSSTAMKTWDNRYVCRSHQEIRNPQDFIRGVKDNMAAPWTRPKPVDVFVGIDWTRFINESPALTEGISKAITVGFGLGRYTDSGVNGAMLNEWALNGSGPVSVIPEDIILSEFHFANNIVPFSEPVAVGLETLTFTISSATAFNGAAFNVLSLG